MIPIRERRLSRGFRWLEMECSALLHTVIPMWKERSSLIDMRWHRVLWQGAVLPRSRLLAKVFHHICFGRFGVVFSDSFGDEKDGVNNDGFARYVRSCKRRGSNLLFLKFVTARIIFSLFWRFYSVNAHRYVHCAYCCFCRKTLYCRVSHLKTYSLHCRFRWSSLW